MQPERELPVHSAGVGTVTFKGRKSGYGNTVIIRHNRKYVTYYAHMRRFGHIRVGSHVLRKTVIGYVGHTGRATGSHLHFEIRRYGRPINPLKATAPTGVTLSRRNLKKFKQHMRKINLKLKKAEKFKSILSNNVRTATIEKSEKDIT